MDNQGMKCVEKEILTILARIDKESTNRLTSGAGRVTMVPFSGTASGEIFSGVILPGAMDTQVEDLTGVHHLSSRYMMQGKDCFGTDCQIYVENNGCIPDNGNGGFCAIPTFYTDSAKLATYLHTNQFVARSEMTENGVTVHFYELRFHAE